MRESIPDTQPQKRGEEVNRHAAQYCLGGRGFGGSGFLVEGGGLRVAAEELGGIES